MGIHFLIAQVIGGLGILLVTRVYGLPKDAYYKYVVFFTGITALLAMIPAVYFYRRDRVCRIAGGLIPSGERTFRKEQLTVKEMLLLLVMGAGLARYGNILAGMLQMFLKSAEYQEMMQRMTDGKSFLMLVFWMGIIAPVAEEMIFRWLVYLRLRDALCVPGAVILSSLIFGVYHGNVLQAFYAGLISMVFAYILEKSGSLLSCIFLHIGANVWSLVLSEYGVWILGKEYGIQMLLAADLVQLFAIGAGMVYFIKKGNKRNARVV